MKTLLLGLLLLAGYVRADTPYDLYSVTLATPTLSTSAYSSGDYMGSIMTVTNACANTGSWTTLDSLNLIDYDNQKIAADLYLWSVSPTITSADNAAININPRDSGTTKAYVNLPAASYTSFNAAAVGQFTNLNIRVKCAAGSKSLYGLLVSRGTPTRTATGLDLNFIFKHN